MMSHFLIGVFVVGRMRPLTAFVGRMRPTKQIDIVGQEAPLQAYLNISYTYRL